MTSAARARSRAGAAERPGGLPVRPADLAPEAPEAEPARPIRVGLVDDHPAVVWGLEAALSRTPDIVVVARAGSVVEGGQLIARSDVDVVLLDVRLPDGSGLDLLAPTRTRPRPSVIVLSSYETRQHRAAVARSGARGFVLKTAPTSAIVDAIRVVARGGTALAPSVRDELPVELTVAERSLVRLALSVRTVDDIAAELGVRTSSVDARLRRLYRRLGISSRTELAIRAGREGWLDPGADRRTTPERKSGSARRDAPGRTR